MEIAGKVFAFEPHGLKFLTTVIVSLPVPTGATGLAAVRAEERGAWSSIAATVGQTNAEIATASFSYFALRRGGRSPGDGVSSDAGIPPAGPAVCKAPGDNCNNASECCSGLCDAGVCS